MSAPKHQLFKAPEVCEMAQLQPYVLRTWEAEFPSLGKVPAGGGPRVYRKADVEKVLLIKQLVFGEGLTLAGARRRLEEDSQPSIAAGAVDDMLDNMARARLRQVRTGLEGILKLLSRDAKPARQPKLQLEPPKAASKTTSGKRRKAS